MSRIRYYSVWLPTTIDGRKTERFAGEVGVKHLTYGSHNRHAALERARELFGPNAKIGGTLRYEIV